MAGWYARPVAATSAVPLCSRTGAIVTSATPEHPPPSRGRAERDRALQARLRGSERRVHVRAAALGRSRSFTNGGRRGDAARCARTATAPTQLLRRSLPRQRRCSQPRVNTVGGFLSVADSDPAKVVTGLWSCRLGCYEATGSDLPAGDPGHGYPAAVADAVHVQRDDIHGRNDATSDHCHLRRSATADQPTRGSRHGKPARVDPASSHATPPEAARAVCQSWT
jgi:hypothetical protein